MTCVRATLTAIVIKVHRCIKLARCFCHPGGFQAACTKGSQPVAQLIFVTSVWWVFVQNERVSSFDADVAQSGFVLRSCNEKNVNVSNVLCNYSWCSLRHTISFIVPCVNLSLKSPNNIFSLQKLSSYIESKRYLLDNVYGMWQQQQQQVWWGWGLIAPQRDPVCPSIHCIHAHLIILNPIVVCPPLRCPQLWESHTQSPITPIDRNWINQEMSGK